MKLREMGSMNCMNEVCRATTSSKWKKGWVLKSGGFATLCYECGSAYEDSVFCDKFHSEEAGWRACRTCRKRIHCGCIASRYLYEYMDFGGVNCRSCTKRLEEIHTAQSMPIPGDIPNGTFVTNSIKDARPIVIEHKINDDKFSTERLLQLTKSITVNDGNSSLEHLKRDEPVLKQSSSSSALVKSDKQAVNDMFDPLSQPSLNFSLSTPASGSSNVVPFSGGTIEESEQSKSQQGQRSRNIFQKAPKPIETNKGGSVSQTRVARPPGEGRGRNQLLPRYWPRITDQELQQLSGDLKSTIVPLFEKILSASDAGKIGRLVLPKACAEAYFPAIQQSQGIPMWIQDITGKEWKLQFRFWPNNNSRMYVLEGVTPCIHNMNLQTGDTVTFSRRDPGGQLVIGCRKASNSDNVQDSQLASVPNGDSPGETSFSGVNDNPFSGGKGSDDSLQQHMTMSEKKKAKNIKNKRHFIHNDDAMELRITWEEAQELFRPSQSAEPTVVKVDDYEFEEFEEPPIFGKRTLFISRPSGEQEQLAQCDSCGKWRRLPVNALLSANWTCSDNIWESNRSSCSAPEDVNPRDLESFFSMNKDFKKRKISDTTPSKQGEPSGLDALATAAVLGDNIVDIAESSVGATTTRHPRHRPGCTCIVCIQPPSGKGKHDPTCKCNVCLTVRRRFKTLMMRKKKRQSDREAVLALEKDKAGPAKIDLEREDIAGPALLNMNHRESEVNESNGNNENNENKGVLDLNCDPQREDDSLTTLIELGGQNGQENVSNEGGSATGDVEQENNNE